MRLTLYALAKKGQISIFLIVGLIVIIIGSVYLYIENVDKIKINDEVDSALSVSIVNEVRNLVESCLKIKAVESLKMLGRQGGYIHSPYQGMDYLNRIVPYYFLPDYGAYSLDLVPSIQSMENEVSGYVLAAFPSCVGRFDYFSERGVSIEAGSPEIVSRINADSFSINLNYPLKGNIGKGEFLMEDFFVEVPSVHIFAMRNASIGIIGSYLQDPASVCISCLLEIGESSKLSVEFIEYLNNTLIFELRDFNNSIAEVYNFTFAIRHDDFSCKNAGKIQDSLFLKECLDDALARQKKGGVT